MIGKLVRAEGNWVEGDRFWNRMEEVRLLMDRIREGGHSLIVAPRRIGKTSLMREVGRRLGDEHISLFVDLQGCQSPAEMVASLAAETRPYQGLWDTMQNVFSNVLDGFSERSGALEIGAVKLSLQAGLAGDEWKGKGDCVFERLASAEKPVVVFIDEIAILVNRLLREGTPETTPKGQSVADVFMSWLRANGIRHKGRVSLVLAGSIGLHPILQQAKLSRTINIFPEFRLGPWDRMTAWGCLRALANQYGVTLGNGAPDQIAEHLGCCIPHHVQMFFNSIYETCVRRGDMTCSAEDVDAIYRDRLLGSKGEVELSHYEERLETVLGRRLYPLASDLLTEAAVEGGLTPSAIAVLAADHEFTGPEAGNVLRTVLSVLEHDGYLTDEGDRYVFVSNLLCDWWKGRHEKFYIPTAKRKG